MRNSNFQLMFTPDWIWHRKNGFSWKSGNHIFDMSRNRKRRFAWVSMGIPDIYYLIIFWSGLFPMMFLMIFQKMTPKMVQIWRCLNIPRGHMKKLRTPSDRASKIMRIQTRLCFKTWIWTGVRGVQRGPDHVEWRTPRFCPKGPPGGRSEGECFAPLMKILIFQLGIFFWAPLVVKPLFSRRFQNHHVVTTLV